MKGVARITACTPAALLIPLAGPDDAYDFDLDWWTVDGGGPNALG